MFPASLQLSQSVASLLDARLLLLRRWPVARPSLPSVLGGVCAYTCSRLQLGAARRSRSSQTHVCAYTHWGNASGGRGVSWRRSTMSAVWGCRAEVPTC